jgi:hypothetical protein
MAAFLQAASGMPVARPGRHGDHAAQNMDLPGLLERLSSGRDALTLLTDLTDEQLDTVPPSRSFRFCDGQRTLEQVVASLLNHQGHQIDAVSAAVTLPGH